MKTTALIALSATFLALEVVLPAPVAAQADPPICKSARDARARNSPAAPNLERQCDTALRGFTQPATPLGRKQKPAELSPADRARSVPQPGPDPFERSRSRDAPLPTYDRSEDQVADPPVSPPWDPYGPGGQENTGGSTPATICQVAGTWRLYQRNAEVELRLEQQGNTFSGYGSSARLGELEYPTNVTPGTVELGEIAGRDVSFRVRWRNSHIGIYKGRIAASGVLEGDAYDFTNPSTTTKWYSSRKFDC